ncbi:glycosyl hydrolase family 28-related protein [Sphingomonas sp. PB1R3]|uniref:glycosyl hydrolase family 28-related protein n=1 Tax=Sphingomonas flavida TaxID=3096154 RepID=UPI002FCC79F1
MNDMMSVRAFGAVGDGRTDDTAAIQRAIDQAVAQPGGGTVWFPPGRYAVRALSCINRDPAEFDRILRLLGAGPALSSIVPLTADAILVDASGRSGFRMESLSIDSTARLSRIGLLLARRQESANCNGTHLRDVRIQGAFAHAAVVSAGAESMVWNECHLHNAHAPARHACLVSSHSPQLAGLGGSNVFVQGPNTDNRFFGCAFYVPYRGAAPVQFNGAAGAMFFGCSIIAGDAVDTRLVSYAVDKGVFVGPVGWYGCHFEVFGRGGIIHFLNAPLGTSYFQGLQCQGGSLVVASGISQVDFDRRDPRRQPVLRGWHWSSPTIPSGVVDVDIHAYLIDHCTIDARVSPDAGAIVALGAIDTSTVDGHEVRAPQVVGFALKRSSTGQPRSGTWPAGSFIDNCDVVPGQATGWRVAKGDGGTVPPAGGWGHGGVMPRPGNIVRYHGAPRVIWYVDPAGQVILDGRDSSSVPVTSLGDSPPKLIALPPL